LKLIVALVFTFYGLMTFLAVVYVVLYYLFGYYVAWQNPELRRYYTGITELKSFYQLMRSTATEMTS
jgi:hypothetical protein